MIHSRAFVFLAVTLCFVACFSADAVSADENREKAEEAVKALQKLTETVFGSAQTKSRKAESAKGDVEFQKKKAESAESDAKRAAATVTAEKYQVDAAAFTQNAKKELDECLQLHQDAKDKAEKASSHMDGLLTRARDLKNNAKIPIPAAPGQPDVYAQVIASAATFTAQTETLKNEIDGASTVLNNADIALTQLKDGAKKVQAVKYQAESLVIVFNIEAKMSEAETVIRSIEEKKDKINTIVQAMNKAFESDSGTSTSLLSSLCSSAESQLQTTSKKLKEAQNSNTNMQRKKTLVDGALSTLKATADETIAKGQFDTIEWHEKSIDEDLQKINKALQAAETSFKSAESVQQQMQNTMSQNKSKSGSEPNKEEQKEDVPTAEVTKPIQNGEAKPAITETGNPTLSKTNEPATPKTGKTDTPAVSRTDGPAITDTENPAVTDTEKQVVTETEKQVVTDTGKQVVTDTEKQVVTDTGKQVVTETEKQVVTDTEKQVVTDTGKQVVTDTEKQVVTDTENPIFGKSENSVDKTSAQPVDANLDNTEKHKSTQLMHDEKQNPKDDNSDILTNDRLRNITKNMTKNPLIDGEVPKWSAANDSAMIVFIPLLVTLIVSAVLH